MTSNPTSRYHLALSRDGRPAMNGWWGSEAVARGKFTEWVGDWGRPGACVTLVDEEAGEVIHRRPDEA